MALFVRRTPSPQPTLIPISLELLQGREGVDGGTPTSGGGSDAAATGENDKNNKSPHPVATLAGVLLFVLGLVVAVNLFKAEGGPTFKAAEGIGAFALFYVAAQAAERFSELFLPAFEKLPGLNKTEREATRDTKVAAALTGAATTTETAVGGTVSPTPAEAAAAAQAAVDQARANRTVVVFGITAGLGVVLCGYLHANFLSAIGVSFPNTQDTFSIVLSMAVTGLVIGGGSKGLHDLIGNISKSSSSKETPQETGGQK